MEYNSIENQLKHLLDQRTITPSDNAWSRVKGRSPQKRNRPMKWWIAAAVVTIAGFLGTYQPNPIAEPVTSIEETIVNESAPVVKLDETTTVVTRRNDITPHQPKPFTTLKTQPFEEVIILPAISGERIEVVAAENIITVDYTSAESLLETAQRELANRKTDVESPTNTTALLREAEADVQQTFQEKVFDIFKHKFKTIKIALKEE